MKKIISSLLFSVLVLAGLNANAQFEKGDKIINVGIGTGFSSLTSDNLGSGGFGINGSYEVGITDFISVGGQLDYLGKSSFGVKYNAVTPAVRGSYHFGKHFLKIDNLDLYGGAALGLGFSSVKWDMPLLGSDKATNTDFHLGLYAGARYYFSPKFGVFSEVGSNAAVFKAGVAFKL